MTSTSSISPQPSNLSLRSEARPLVLDEDEADDEPDPVGGTRRLPTCRVRVALG